MQLAGLTQGLHVHTCAQTQHHTVFNRCISIMNSSSGIASSSASSTATARRHARQQQQSQQSQPSLFTPAAC